jgi:DNA-binding CsgD family transcriptional regulator
MTVEMHITETEIAMITEFAEGRTDQQVSDKIHLELNSMRNLKRNLMAKVGALNAAHLVAFGFRKGILK